MTNFFSSSRTIKQLSVPLCTDLYSIAKWKMNQVNIKKDFFFQRMEKKKPHWFLFSFPVTYLVSIHLFIYIQSTLKKNLFDKKFQVIISIYKKIWNSTYLKHMKYCTKWDLPQMLAICHSYLSPMSHTSWNLIKFWIRFQNFLKH